MKHGHDVDKRMMHPNRLYCILRYGLDIGIVPTGVLPYVDPNDEARIGRCIGNFFGGSALPLHIPTCAKIVMELEAVLAAIPATAVTVWGSGGLDSAILTAAAVRVGKAVTVLTVGFHDEWHHFDESEFARRVYSRFPVNHRLVRMTPDAAEIFGQRCTVRRFFTPHRYLCRQSDPGETILTGYGAPLLFGMSYQRSFAGVADLCALGLRQREVFGEDEAQQLLGCSLECIEPAELDLRTQIVTRLNRLANSNACDLAVVAPWMLYEWPDFLSELEYLSKEHRLSILTPYLTPGLLSLCGNHRLHGLGRLLREELGTHYGIRPTDLVPHKQGLVPPLEMWLKRELRLAADTVFSQSSANHPSAFPCPSVVHDTWNRFIAEPRYSGSWTGYCKVWLLLQLLKNEHPINSGTPSGFIAENSPAI